MGQGVAVDGLRLALERDLSHREGSRGGGGQAPHEAAEGQEPEAPEEEDEAQPAGDEGQPRQEPRGGPDRGLPRRLRRVVAQRGRRRRGPWVRLLTALESFHGHPQGRLILEALLRQRPKTRIVFFPRLEDQAREQGQNPGIVGPADQCHRDARSCLRPEGVQTLKDDRKGQPTHPLLLSEERVCRRVTTTRRPGAISTCCSSNATTS